MRVRVCACGCVRARVRVGVKVWLAECGPQGVGVTVRVCLMGSEQFGS